MATGTSGIDAPRIFAQPGKQQEMATLTGWDAERHDNQAALTSWDVERQDNQAARLRGQAKRMATRWALLQLKRDRWQGVPAFIDLCDKLGDLDQRSKQVNAVRLNDEVFCTANGLMLLARAQAPRSLFTSVCLPNTGDCCDWVKGRSYREHQLPLALTAYPIEELITPEHAARNEQVLQRFASSNLVAENEVFLALVQLSTQAILQTVTAPPMYGAKQRQRDCWSTLACVPLVLVQPWFWLCYPHVYRAMREDRKSFDEQFWQSLPDVA